MRLCAAADHQLVSADRFTSRDFSEVAPASRQLAGQHKRPRGNSEGGGLEVSVSLHEQATPLVDLGGAGEVLDLLLPRRCGLQHRLATLRLVIDEKVKSPDKSQFAAAIRALDAIDQGFVDNQFYAPRMQDTKDAIGWKVVPRAGGLRGAAVRATARRHPHPR